MAPLLSRARLAGRLLGAAGARALASTTTPPSSQLAAIKALREASGAPMSDVKAALVEAGWDADGAFAALRKKGLAAAQKKVGARDGGRADWLRAEGLGAHAWERTRPAPGGKRRGPRGGVQRERQRAPHESIGQNLASPLPLTPSLTPHPSASHRPPATPPKAWSACPSPGRAAPWSR